MTLEDPYELSPLRNLGALSVLFPGSYSTCEGGSQRKRQRGEGKHSDYATRGRSSPVSQHSCSSVTVGKKKPF